MVINWIENITKDKIELRLFERKLVAWRNPDENIIGGKLFCRLKAPSESQRLAPLISIPEKLVAATRMMPAPRTRTAMRRMPRGDNMETANRISNAGTINAN